MCSSKTLELNGTTMTSKGCMEKEDCDKLVPCTGNNCTYCCGSDRCNYGQDPVVQTTLLPPTTTIEPSKFYGFGGLLDSLTFEKGVQLSEVPSCRSQLL